MKAIVILLDSLNRRFLPAYGAEEPAITPNIDRLAARSVVFDGHFCGSAPCMPARRDLMTGRLNFLERPWGGIEPYDHTLPALLRTNNVYTRIETDHYHYAAKGGEDYLGNFSAWQLHRGAENDTFFSGPDKGGIRQKPEGFVGRFMGSYVDSHADYAGSPERFSTPRTLTAAAEWLERFRDADNYLLWAEGFDPHEPFDVPDAFIEMYGETPRHDLPYWPSYNTTDNYTEEQLHYFRVCYKALVTMTDRYVGRILDVLDRYDMWKDTTVILTTDHGFMLGEHGYMAKNYMPDYNEVQHLPLMIAAPGVEPGRRQALTQNIDVLPTLLETFGVQLSRCRNKLHGKSLLPLLADPNARVRDAVLSGVFGKTVNMNDGRYVYLRRTVSETNEPLYIYGADMAVMGYTIGYDSMSKEDIDQIEMGRFLPWTNYPVYKVPAKNLHWGNSSLNPSTVNRRVPSTLLFDLATDPGQMHPLTDAALEAQCREKLIALMREHDAPVEQFERLGL